MPRGSHLALIHPATAASTRGTLAGAFSQFIQTSGRFKNSYLALQGAVFMLRRELATRDALVNASLATAETLRVTVDHIVASMPGGVIVVNHDQRIANINQEACRLLQLHKSTALQSTLPELSDHAGLPLHAFARQDGSTPDCSREVSLSPSRWLEIRIRRLPAGTPQRTILLLRDITAQKHAEQYRNSGSTALALAEVSAILANEMQRPLASLELFAELVELDDERRPEWISNLRSSIRTLSATVNTVLSSQEGPLAECDRRAPEATEEQP